VLGIPKIDESDEHIKDYLSGFWEIYSKYDAWALVNNTHKEGTTWHQVSEAYKRGEIFSNIIPKDLLKIYFKNLLSATHP
jgi:uncharacterized phage-associated protein